MPYKDPEKRRAQNKMYGASWYERNKERHKATAAINRKIARDKWNEFKAGLACEVCGFSHPAAIDFHHMDPVSKNGEINRLSGVGSYKRAYEEIEKCIPLCSNCHRILHWNESRKASHGT